ELDKVRRRVATRLASLTKEVGGPDAGLERVESVLAMIDSGEEALVLTAIAEGVGGLEFPAAGLVDLARHLIALARRPAFPLGTSSRDRHPQLASSLLEALADAADPEQAARLLGAFFSPCPTPT